MQRLSIRSIIIPAALIIAGEAPASAAIDSINKFPEQRLIDKSVASTKVIVINPASEGNNVDSDSVRSLINNFYVEQYRHTLDPQAPYFMFMSKDANFALGVGGLVRMRGWFDWNNSIDANGFSPALIQIPPDPAARKRLSATPAGTGLFLTLIGRHTPIGNIKAYIEANFNGYQHIDFKLKKAYISVGDWTAGYTTTTFSDPAAEPVTVDGAGANGVASKSTVLVRYFHTFRCGFSLAAALEFPSSQIRAVSGESKACTDYVPDIVALAQYQWDQGMSHVRIAGIYRNLSYRNLLKGTNHNVPAWGGLLSAIVKILPQLSISGEFNYGRGIGSYVGDFAVMNADLLPAEGEPGILKAPTVIGGAIGLKYNFTDNIYANIVYGRAQYAYKQHQPADYRYGNYGAANIFWNITPRLLVGAEYLVGNRKNYDGTHGPANRVDALFSFTF